MSKTPSVRKNYIYNLIYQVMTLITLLSQRPIFPVFWGRTEREYKAIPIPWSSILLYWRRWEQLLMGRGRSQGTGDDLKMRSRLFWEIEMLCMATTAACLIIWLFVIGFAKEYRPYYIVLTMTLTAVAFDISWFFWWS